MQRWLNYVCSNETLMRDDEMVLFVESDFGYSPMVKMKQPATGVRRKILKQFAPPPDDTPELADARPIVKLFYLGTMDAGHKVDKMVKSRRGTSNKSTCAYVHPHLHTPRSPSIHLVYTDDTFIYMFALIPVLTAMHTHIHISFNLFICSLLILLAFLTRTWTGRGRFRSQARQHERPRTTPRPRQRLPQARQSRPDRRRLPRRTGHGPSDHHRRPLPVPLARRLHRQGDPDEPADPHPRVPPGPRDHAKPPQCRRQAQGELYRAS